MTKTTAILGFPEPFRAFLAIENASAFLLMGMAVLAMALANSGFSEAYLFILHLEVGGMSLTHWVNDGLMAIFFLLMGLEIKRELLSGELSSPKQAALPLLAAVGGMICPALIYVAFNFGTEFSHGWGIPMATDIAFALGVLSLAGKRLPLFLKVFLTALAIVDDLGAIAVIALFYTSTLSVMALSASALVFAALVICNYFGIQRRLAYIGLGFLLWIFILRSGIHATVAGVLLAVCIPSAMGPQLEHRIHPWVAFLIMPLFALFNAGVPLQGAIDQLGRHPTSLGIVLGLLLGKVIGVFGFTFGATKLGIAALPQEIRWSQILGVATLAGIGFTMSLFIAALAFPSPEVLDIAKISVLCASVVAAIVGFFLLRIFQANAE